jgi:hypothetical protein
MHSLIVKEFKVMKRACQVMVVILATVTGVWAADRRTRYVISSDLVRVVTDLTISDTTSPPRQTLAPGSRVEAIRAIDVRTGERLHSTLRDHSIDIALSNDRTEGAEPRVRVEEESNVAAFIKRNGDAISFETSLPPGVNEIVLPAGYSVSVSSLPATVTTEGGVTRLGMIVAGNESRHFTLEASKGRVAEDAPIAGSFRADDERKITYWLDDPGAHQLHLALDLVAKDVGLTHVFSVLRPNDHIANAHAADPDTGRPLASRILSGSEAAKLPGAPPNISPDATVMVVDLAAPIRSGASTRIRLFQSATDDSYRLLPDGQVRWDRFLARLDTRVVLAKGWILTSVDQPTRLGRDSEGRQTLNFLHAGGDSPRLTLTARRTQ